MTAPLKYRCEHKFRVTELQYRTLRSRLSAVLRRDRHGDENNEYHIRSVYFDDHKNRSFFEKLAGSDDRKKYRIRIYDKRDKVIHLERKSKRGQYCNKVRASLNREQTERILGGDVEFLYSSNQPLLTAFYLETRTNAMHPVVVVDYFREAYTHPLGNVRITFDKKLAAGFEMGSFFDPAMITFGALQGPEMIMEIKYDDYLPEFVKGLLLTSVPQRMAISKFVLCRRLASRNDWEDA